MSLENGGKRRGAGRKAAEEETPQKPSRGGKRPGAGRPSPGLAPTAAPVESAPAADQSLINQKRVVGGDKRGGARRGAGRKTVEQETRRETLAGGGRPGDAPTAPPLAPTEPLAQTPEEFLGVVMNDPANPSGHGPG